MLHQNAKIGKIVFEYKNLKILKKINKFKNLFAATFGVHNRLLTLLRFRFAEIFKKMEAGGNVPETEMVLSSSVSAASSPAIFTIKSGLIVEPNWSELSHSIPPFSKQGMVGKFFEQFFGWIDADFRPQNVPNQLVFHAAMASYAQKLLETEEQLKEANNADDEIEVGLLSGGNAAQAAKLAKLSKCLIRLIPKFGKFEHNSLGTEKETTMQKMEETPEGREIVLEARMAHLERAIDVHELWVQLQRRRAEGGFK